jgi:hypothetical protein
MSKWWLVIALGVQVHFGASYLVPLEVKDQGAIGGLLRWVWPWGVGDTGLLGRMDPAAMPMAGFWIAMAVAVLSALAALAVLGIWVPETAWRPLAISAAVLSLALMAGFFGPTKALPILLALALIGIAALRWGTFEVA